MASTHGWALEDRAVFLSPLTDGAVDMGLWLQRGRDTDCIAMFASAQDAQDFSDFMDDALAATGSANRKLLAQLEGRT